MFLDCYWNRWQVEKESRKGRVEDSNSTILHPERRVGWSCPCRQEDLEIVSRKEIVVNLKHLYPDIHFEGIYKSDCTKPGRESGVYRIYIYFYVPTGPPYHTANLLFPWDCPTRLLEPSMHE